MIRRLFIWFLLTKRWWILCTDWDWFGCNAIPLVFVLAFLTLLKLFSEFASKRGVWVFSGWRFHGGIVFVRWRGWISWVWLDDYRKIVWLMSKSIVSYSFHLYRQAAYIRVGIMVSHMYWTEWTFTLSSSSLLLLSALLALYLYLLDSSSFNLFDSASAGCYCCSLFLFPSLPLRPPSLMSETPRLIWVNANLSRVHNSCSSFGSISKNFWQYLEVNC